MRIVVDQAKCTGLGMCEAEASDIFEVAPDGSLIIHQETIGSDQLAAAEAAVAACPTEALRIERD
ncbi:MAG: 3Fe-4S ferredoxin [Marmoricola sp.]|nr:3Fe-4S ferredoxin [Marmoricola sp.]